MPLPLRPSSLDCWASRRLRPQFRDIRPVFISHSSTILSVCRTWIYRLLPALHAHLPCTSLLNSEECALLEKKKKKVSCDWRRNVENVGVIYLLNVLICSFKIESRNTTVSSNSIRSRPRRSSAVFCMHFRTVVDGVSDRLYHSRHALSTSTGTDIVRLRRTASRTNRK